LNAYPTRYNRLFQGRVVS